MGSGSKNFSRRKLSIIFGLFVALIIGLIFYQVNVYTVAQEQRKNIKKSIMQEMKILKTEYKKDLNQDSLKSKEEDEQD